MKAHHTKWILLAAVAFFFLAANAWADGKRERAVSLDPVPEALFLLFGRYGQPVLNERGAGLDQGFLKPGAYAEKFIILIICTKTHYSLNAGTVIPATVKKYYLSRCREV